MCQIAFAGCLSIMIFCSCNSGQSQGGYYSSQTEVEKPAETDLSDCYDQIKDLSHKMQEEGSAFWEQITPVSQDYPTSACALTEAHNHGMFIDGYLSAVVQGDNVIANLQHIDSECYHVERFCADGIVELRNDNEYISASFKDSWISVLKRISNYSSSIREQVQIIRNNQ